MRPADQTPTGSEHQGMNRLRSHIRGNAVAYLALFVALGGTGYAATNLPANSVGNRQIRNGAITPVKLDRKLVAGSVRAWAEVSATGRVLAGEGSPKVQLGTGPGSLGRYFVTWKTAQMVRCAAIGSVAEDNGRPGFVLATLEGRTNPTSAVAQVYNTMGQSAALPFSIVVLC
jgi:hypothetical protein